LTEKSQALAATVVGAIVGGMAGYMFFTDNGRTMRRQLEPALDDISREISSFKGTLNRALGVANEGWKVLNEALGEGGGSSRFPTPHQTSPF
jgi:gas vesicle protein